MKHQQNHRAERLLDAIGEIDDCFLDEAVRYRATRPAIRYPLRNFAAVAAIAAILLIAVMGPMSAVLDFLKGSESPDTPSNVPTAVQEHLLAGCAQSPAFTLSAADEINFFDGTVRLTVEDRRTGEVYVSRPLTEAQQLTLSREFTATGKQVAASEPPSEYRVWVLLGDGSVITPYLNPTAGNIGTAVLFDYEDERIPTEYFTNLIEELK